MDSKLFQKAALYLMKLKVGDGFQDRSGRFVICVKNGRKKLVLSNGEVFFHKSKNGNRYMIGKPTGMGGLMSDTFYLTLFEIMDWMKSRVKVKV
jgi:hypothetical protein